MSSQLTCGSKRVANMLARRLRFTERSPLPWPFPVTPVFFLGRAPVEFTRDGCLVLCRRRTTVVHSVVVGARLEVDGAQTDVDGSQTDVDGAQTDVDGAQTDVDGAQTDVDGAQTDVNGARMDVDDAQIVVTADEVSPSASHCVSSGRAALVASCLARVISSASTTAAGVTMATGTAGTMLAVSTAAIRRSTALTISVRSTVASRCMPTLALRTSISS